MFTKIYICIAWIVLCYALVFAIAGIVWANLTMLKIVFNRKEKWEDRLNFFNLIACIDMAVLFAIAVIASLIFGGGK